MKKFYGIILCLAFLAFKTNIKAQTPDPVVYYYHYYNINNVERLKNTTLKDKVIQTFLSGPDNINPDVQYNTDNLKLITFEGSDIKGVYAEEVNFAPNSIHNHTFFAYVQGNLVADMAAEVAVNIDNSGTTTCDILDHTGQTVGSVIVGTDYSVSLSVNPNWSDPYAMFLNNSNNLLALYGPNIDLNQNLSSFWDRFSNCLRTGFSQMYGSGSNAATLGGVVFIGTGSCAAPGALLGCALHASFF